MFELSNVYLNMKEFYYPGGNYLIKVTGGSEGGPTVRFLPRAIQQLKLLPRADTKSHF